MFESILRVSPCQFAAKFLRRSILRDVKRLTLIGVAMLLVLLVVASAQAMAAQRVLTIDDVLGRSWITSTAVSPDGSEVASVVIRPAGPGNIYGRTYYEQDVTRADIWLMSRRDGSKRPLTKGLADASGFWCATWSPDGSRMALLSTQPEAGEPRGGDNVRLYVWELKDGSLKRLTTRGIRTASFAMFDSHDNMHGANGGNFSSGRCRAEENAPFLWVDDHTLIALELSKGAVSDILNVYPHVAKADARSAKQMQDGEESTATMEASGAAAHPVTPSNVTLDRIDVASGRDEVISTIPVYAFDSEIQVQVTQDGHSAAVLTTIDAIAPHVGTYLAYPFAPWSQHHRLGLVDLHGGAGLRWVQMPADGEYVIGLTPWAADGNAIAVFAKAEPTTLALGLFAVDRRDSSVKRISPETLSVSAPELTAQGASAPTVIALKNGQWLARAVPAANELSPSAWYLKRAHGEAVPRTDWWLMGRDGDAVKLTSAWKSVPRSFQPGAADDTFLGMADGAVWSLDIHTRSPTRLTQAPLAKGAAIAWPQDGDASYGRPTELLIAGKGNLVRLSLAQGNGKVSSVALPSPTSKLESYQPRSALLLFKDASSKGMFLWATDAAGARPGKLLAVDEGIADITFGKRMLFKYRGVEGQTLNAGVILPPDYQPGKRYPVVLWVYAGSRVRDDWADDAAGDAYSSGSIYKEGEYNLHLYAAQSYVVLVPSMPLMHVDGYGSKNDDYMDLPKGVMPAVDHLIDMGIADPDRLAVMGQSYGGYSVYSLVTYTHRFKAAIAMAGLTDLVSGYGTFDPLARGYDGIEHQRSGNAGLDENGQVGMGVPPWEDALRYLRNSPLFYADRVQTPLLMIHGELDARGPTAQAEEFFSALYRQGKTAKLLRYWGEDHGLRLSPANVRSIVSEILDWLKVNMPAQAESSKPR